MHLHQSLGDFVGELVGANVGVTLSAVGVKVVG